jgi:hypothetical protein
MYNPVEIADSDGEWVELYNVSGETLDLSTCVLKDDLDDELAPMTGASLEAGSFGVVGASLDPALFGGVTPIAVLGFGLNNGEDSVILQCGDQIIDQVDYNEANGWLEATGASLNLSADASTAEANDASEVWCLGSGEYASGNLGTPGAANGLCEDEPVELCGETPVQGSLIVGMQATGSLMDANNRFSSECVDGGPDEIWTLSVAQAGTFCIDTFGSAELVDPTDTSLSVRTTCLEEGTELSCNDDAGDTFDSRVEVQAEAGQTLFVIVSGSFFSDTADYVLNVSQGPCPE